ncbi:nucleotide sugar dehydrogenase [Candidatus Methylopumilus rimovensis]|nr:nucleotide sugar dehydrogenase [Candidatus Methylopumilus rimovensis]
MPLAIEFSKNFSTIGFDLSADKVNSYKNFFDPSGEISTSDLKDSLSSGNLVLTSDPINIAKANFFIIAVPTPVDNAHTPDFNPLILASKIVGKYLTHKSIVIYESTVYPGATEEICIPILEEASGLSWKTHFNVGYSPERINPGDKERTLRKIIKVVSADTSETLEKVATLYESIIDAGVHRAGSIAVAEAAKVIENTQRDLNIALMNELSIIFHKIGIDTTEVLEAAGTKWNFLKFKPGLVGGHCIGVDPYYLTYKAEKIGYHPQVILAGRRINDSMGKYVAENTVKLMIHQGLNVKGAKVCILGFTFKEDCTDLRNTKVIDILRELNEFGCDVIIHDPLANPVEAKEEFNVKLTSWHDLIANLDAVIVAVPHKEFLKIPIFNILDKLNHKGVFVDVKSAFDEKVLKENQICFWRL